MKTKVIYQLLVVVPVISLTGLAACSDVAGTAEEHATTPNRVTTYMTQSNEQSDGQHIDSDPDPTYEWFY